QILTPIIKVPAIRFIKRTFLD
ncbi:hypothetical protein VCHENC02_1721B, partial [Vibrio harveyi]